MNQNAAGQPSKADIAALESLRTKLMPLVYNIEELQRQVSYNPTAPPEWPYIQRSIAGLSSTLDSIQTLLNDPTTSSTLRSMHPYPISPFPTGNIALANLSQEILRKKANPGAEIDWIESRLAKAQEFAHVPEDFGVEPRKLKDYGEGEDSEDDDDGRVEGGDAAKLMSARKIRRTKGTLDEDQIAEIWGICGDIVMQEMENVGADTGSQDSSESSSPEDTTMGGMGGSAQTGDAASGKAKAVVAAPMMSLETIHKFMTTGHVPEPEGQ